MDISKACSEMCSYKSIVDVDKHWIEFDIVVAKKLGPNGVKLLCKAKKTDCPYKIVINGKDEEITIVWEDITDMTDGEILRTIIDVTMPGGPVERTIIYKVPFAKCDREEDYEIAWREFERRLK